MKWIMFFVVIVALGAVMSSGGPDEATTPSTAHADDKAQDYRIACRLRLKHEAIFRSKVDITTVEAMQAPKDPNIWFVKGTADMMIGIGAIIPHTFMCKFDSGYMVDFAAAPGD